MVRCADTPGSPGGPGTGADAAPATPVQDVTPTDDPRPVGITCDSDTEEIPTIIVGSDEVDSESDDEEAVGTPAEGAADTQVSAPAKKKQTKKDREKAEKQAHRIQLESEWNVVPDMGTVQLKCTHIQGRNYHNPFAVALSTNEMFTDVLHSRVIDHHNAA